MARALSGASLARARNGDSLCYIERFGRLPYRVIAEAFDRYAEELQREADNAVSDYRLIMPGQTPEEPTEEPTEESVVESAAEVKPVRRRKAREVADDEPEV